MKSAEELLYDSEASLRLVDHAIAELSVSGAELDREPSGLLARAYGDSAGMLDGGGLARLRQMHGHLREVASATETATTGILDGLSRAGSLVEQLDGASALSDAERHQMASSLREQLSNVIDRLQFQDITDQQLKHIGNLLGDMDRGIAQGLMTHPDVSDAAGQAVADEIVANRGTRKTA